jgi:hypothetical protein
MKNSEKAALYLSLLAVFISALTLYFSEFHTSELLEAVVLEVDPIGGSLDYQVAILNQGNRQAILTSARIAVASNDNVLVASNPFEKVRITPEFPAIIEPEHVLIVRFNGPLDLAELHARGGAPDRGFEEFDGKPGRKVVLRADFEARDFKGREYSAIIGVATVHLTPATVAGSGELPPLRAVFRRER